MEQTKTGFEFKYGMAGAEINTGDETYVLKVKENQDDDGALFGHWVPKGEKGLTVITTIKNGPEPDATWAETSIHDGIGAGKHDRSSTKVKSLDDVLMHVERALETMCMIDKTCITDEQLGKLIMKSIDRAIKGDLLTEADGKDIMVEGVSVSVVRMGKYTVVELRYKGLTYHGLSAQHPDDFNNGLEGTGRAYSRAFNQLCVKEKFGHMSTVHIKYKSSDVKISKEVLAALVSLDG